MTTPDNSPHDLEVADGIDALMRQVGGDPDSFSGQLVREMMTSCLKLVRDGADTGELKLISRSIKELRYALKVFRPYRGIRKISMFGSARTPEDDPTYLAAVDFARHVSQSGWMVITGAGDGIMKAGHGGAGREGSFGVSIRLPFETNANEIIAGDSKLVTFRYFFTRKLLFVSQADAVALFAGGFGTHDEGFEVLTLIQTGKSPLVPLVMVDAPDDDYWKQWDAYVRRHLLNRKMISPEDLNLYMVTDDPRKAADYVLKFYSNYHSQRFVKDHLVIRMNHKLSAARIDALNSQFGDLVVPDRGRIEQVEAYKVEEDFLDLPRLSFVFNRRNYGKLRRLIDAINE